MYAIFGRGCVQTENEPARILYPGDVVYLDPGVKHWHGAAREEDFIHSVIAFDKKSYWSFRTTDENGNSVMKAEMVSSDVYRRAFESDKDRNPRLDS